MATKHIAASGASAGQWVTCNAQQACRNGGMHLDSSALKEVSSKTYTPINALTAGDVRNYYAQLRQATQQEEPLLQRLMRLKPSSDASPTTSSEQPTRELPTDQYLSDDDSLTLDEKREIFSRQYSQAQHILGNLANYTIERTPENKDLVFKSNSAQETSRLVFRSNPEDPKEYSITAARKSYHQGQEYARRAERYNSNGELHGNGKPARIEVSSEAETTEYFENGKLHRDDDQPAKTMRHEDGTTTLWYAKDGEIHRDADKPASIESNLFTGKTVNSYYTEGKLRSLRIDQDPTFEKNES